MGKKNISRPIDMTACGHVFDRDGYMDCSDNFCEILFLLHTRKVLPKKLRKITVLVSIVYGPVNSPQRGSLQKTYTFGFLCRDYKKWFKQDFDPKGYVEESRKEHHWRLETYRKQGEKTMAWSSYTQYLHTDKLLKQEAIVRSLPTRQEQDAKRDEFEKQNGTPMLRIG